MKKQTEIQAIKNNSMKGYTGTVGRIEGSIFYPDYKEQLEIQATRKYHDRLAEELEFPENYNPDELDKPIEFEGLKT